MDKHALFRPVSLDVNMLSPEPPTAFPGITLDCRHIF
jgi:hypothetical protein